MNRSIRNVGILLLLFLSQVAVGERDTPIPKGKLTTPLNANSQSITNLSLLKFTNGQTFDGTLPELPTDVVRAEGTNMLWQAHWSLSNSVFAVTQRANDWNTAYGWGDHSQAGYVHQGESLFLTEAGGGISFPMEANTPALWMNYEGLRDNNDFFIFFPINEFGNTAKTLATREWVADNTASKGADSTNAYYLVSSQNTCFAVASNNAVYVYEVREAGIRGTNEMYVADTDVLVDDFFVLQAPVIGTRYPKVLTEGNIDTFINPSFADHTGHVSNDLGTPYVELMFTAQAFVGCTYSPLEPQTMQGYFRMGATPGVQLGTYTDVIIFTEDYTLYPTGGLETNLIGRIAYAHNIPTGIVTNYQPEVAFSNITITGEIVFPNGVRMTGKEQLNGSNTIHFTQPGDTSKFYITFPLPPN